jgi:hypothetical protein
MIGKVTYLAVRRIGALLVALILGVGASAPAAADYLSAIQAAGEKLPPLGQARKEEETLRRLQQQQPAPAAAAKPAAPVAGGMKGFEEQLRGQFPGSFALYALMDNREKEQVYGEFQSSKGDGSARFLPVVTRIISISTAKRPRGP